jgi:hypothetical protein
MPRDCEHGHLARSCDLCRIPRMEDALTVERTYWQTRREFARTRTEEVMAEYHLDLIDGALR